MTLRVRDIPKTYEDANKLLNSHNKRKISKNGWICKEEYILGPILKLGIRLVLFNTSIVTWYEDGSIYLNTGGYNTRTTSRWINKALPIGRVSKIAGEVRYHKENLNYSYSLPCLINSLGIPVQ